MKICQCCGAQCAPEAPYCPVCGEASFVASADTDPPTDAPPADTDPPAAPNASRARKRTP